MYVEIYSERMYDSTRGKTSWGLCNEKSMGIKVSGGDLRISFSYRDDSPGDGSRGGDDRTMYRMIKVDFKPDDLKRIMDFAISNNFLSYGESEVALTLGNLLKREAELKTELQRENEKLKGKIDQALSLLNAK